MQMLHCIENETIGGENEFCDGFTVANQLRENNKEKFDVLTSVGVDFQDIGEDVCGKFYKIHRFPTIRFIYKKKCHTFKYPDYL